MALRMTFCVKLIKTFILTISWICLGFYSEILGPSLPTLRSQVNATTEEMSRVLSARSFGLLLGSIVGGVLQDRFNKRRYLITGSAVAVAAGLILIVPFCRVLWLLGITLFFIGVCHAFHTTGGNPILVEIWQENSGGPLNLLHSGYGIGAAITPLIIQAFAKEDISGYLSFHHSNPNATRTDPHIELMYPYAIVSGICLFSAILLVCVIFFDRRSRPPSVDGIEIPSENENKNLTPNVTPSSKLSEFWATLRSSKRDMNFTIGLMVLIFLYYFFLVGGDRVHSRFLFTYATESVLAFTDSEAYSLNSLFWIGYTIGRIAMALVLIWTSSDAILCVEMMGAVVTAAMMIFAPGDKTLFWVGSFAYAFMKSPTYPTGLAVINNYLEINGIVTIIVSCGGATGALVMQWSSGFLYDIFGPSVIIYAAIGLSILLMTAGSIIIFIGHIKGSRFYNPDDSHSVTTISADDEDGSKSLVLKTQIERRQIRTSEYSLNATTYSNGHFMKEYDNAIYNSNDTKL